MARRGPEGAGAASAKGAARSGGDALVARRTRRDADARGELGGDARGPARDACRRRAFAWRDLARAAALLGVVSGCERVPEVTPADLAAVAPYVLDAAPPIPHPLDVRFGDKLQLLGYGLRETAPVHAGQVLHLTLYWRCDAPLGEPGWELFTHVRDAEGEPLAAADYEGPLRRFLDTRPVLWPSDWVAGKVYVDEQLVELPRRLKTSSVTLTEGVWRGRRLLPVVGGAKAEDGGAVLFTLPVEPLAPGARP